MRKKLVTANIIAIIVMLLSCQKYEDGPLISFRSPEKRLIRDWVLDETLIDGEVQENYFRNGSTFSFSSGNEFLFYRISDSAEWRGNWQFLDKNLQLYCEGDYYSSSGNIFSNSTEIFDILKLSSKQLWLKSTISGPHPPPYNEIEYHYISL